jgi:hypothetical protein
MNWGWVLALLGFGTTAALTSAWVWRQWPRWRALRALARLQHEWERGGQLAPLYAGLSRLLRSTALALCREPAAAGLSGEGWLGFLDETGGTDAFTRGRGRVLASAPYQPERQLRARAGGEVELIMLVRSWIRRARPVVRP